MKSIIFFISERKFSWKGDWIVVWKEYCKIWATIWGIPWLILFKLLVLEIFIISIFIKIFSKYNIGSLCIVWQKETKLMSIYNTTISVIYWKFIRVRTRKVGSWIKIWLFTIFTNRLASVKRKTLVLDLDETLIHSQHDGMGRQTVARPGSFFII